MVVFTIQYVKPLSKLNNTFLRNQIEIALHEEFMSYLRSRKPSLPKQTTNLSTDSR